MPKSPDEFLKDFKKAADHVAEASERTDKHWRAVGEAISASTRKLETGFLKTITTFTGLAPALKSVGLSLADAFLGSKKNVDYIHQRWAEAKRIWQSPTSTPAEAARAEAEMARLLKERRAYRDLTKEIGAIMHGQWTLAATAFVGQIALGYRYSHEMQEQLKQTAADYDNRARLMREIAQIQAATGNEMADMGKGAAALADYGFDLRDGFKDTLTTMVKMEEGLGVSYQTSSQMAVAVKRIGGNFSAVADTVARIKADTALSADEAARFATQISKAVMMLKPGSGSLVSQTTDYISRVAAALKELTGDGKGFVDMMASFTTEAGMMGAATLGATPDFLASPEQTKLVTERFVKYVNQQLSGTSGFQRMATIQLLAEQFNTSADVIANADEMLKRYNETQRKGVSLDEEWRKQTAEFGKTMSKIGKSLSAIVQQSLIPVVRFFNPILEKLAEGIQWFAKSSVALYVGIGALGISAIGAVITVSRLTAAVIRFGVASGLVSNSIGGIPGKIGSSLGRIGTMLRNWGPVRNLASMGTAAAAGQAGGVAIRIPALAGATGWMARIAGYLSRILGVVAGPIAAAAAAGLAGAAVGLAVDKYILKGMLGYDLAKGWSYMMDKKNVSRMQQLSYGSGGMTRNEILQQVSAMAASGKSADEIQKFILRSASSVKGLHGESLTKERREKILKDILQDAGQEITRQRVRMGYARQLTESTAEDRAKDAEMIELYKAIAHNTALQNELLQRAEYKHESIEERKRIDQEEYAGEARLQRQATESQNRVGNTPGGATFHPIR